MKYVYPAVITRDKEIPTAFNVVFPDIIAGYTCGDSFDDALFMAKDLLKLMIEEVPAQVFPPSTVEDLEKDYPKEDIYFIEVEI